MKKFNQLILGLVALVAFAYTASAQLGFDTFSATRTYVLTTPQNVVVGTAPITNFIDKIKLGGTGKIDFTCVTNTSTTGGTLTATLYTSVDQTNLVALSNFALITSPTTENITNFLYGATNFYAANSVMLPGTITTPTAYSAGFNTPYLAPAPFTNSAAITLNGNKTVQVGLRLTDLPRYIYVVYTPGGTVTNFTVSATLTGVHVQ